MSGTILQNYPCHSSEDVIAALREYNLNPLKHSFKTDSPSRPFETIGKIRRSKSNLISYHSTSMGKITKPRQNSSKPVSLINIDNNSPDRYPNPDDTEAVGDGDGENHYKQTMKKPANDSQRQYTVNFNLVENHKVYMPTREHICVREPDNIQTNIDEELENRNYDMNLDQEHYDSKHHSMTKDVGVQATVYHCNACRRHLKYNQDYMPATKERVFESEPESKQTNTEDELETGTAFKQIFTGSDQSNRCDAVETSSETSEYNKSKSTNKEPRKRVPSFEKQIQTDFRANEPDKQRSIAAFFEQLFTKINGYGRLEKCIIIFLILVVFPLLASITFMGSEVLEYFNLRIILKCFNRPEEPKIEVVPKGYIDLATDVLKSVWIKVCFYT